MCKKRQQMVANKWPPPLLLKAKHSAIGYIMRIHLQICEFTPARETSIASASAACQQQSSLLNATEDNSILYMVIFDTAGFHRNSSEILVRD